MKKNMLKLLGVAVCGTFASGAASAYTIDTGNDDLTASLVSNVTAGLGVRTKDPSCALTGTIGAYGCTSPNTAQWANGDNGDLNFKRGQAFTGYLSLTSELLMTMPSEGLKFLVRGTGMYDAMADRTQQTPLSTAASNQVVRDAQLLDLWIQKDFRIGDERAHVRFGNQVINWGESYFAAGGINATNSLDIQKLLIPGTQLKQALLPAPMISFASSMPDGFSTEDYLQFQWNGNRYPAVGSYWSASNVF